MSFMPSDSPDGHDDNRITQESTVGRDIPNIVDIGEEAAPRVEPKLPAMSIRLERPSEQEESLPAWEDDAEASSTAATQEQNEEENTENNLEGSTSMSTQRMESQGSGTSSDEPYEVDGEPSRSGRRKLSKQAATLEEPLPASSTVPEVRAISETIDEDENESTEAPQVARPRQLVRGLALCGDDDTRLRPPPPQQLQRHPQSLSRESSGGGELTGTDAGGMDLRSFVIATLHKNPRDRQMILGLEQQLIGFVNDEKLQSMKFNMMSSYNRMLVHRVAVLFGLDHNVDNSGQCVVVNKTDRTKLPEVEFSSLIREQQAFTDSKKQMRSVHSHDEPTRDPSLLGYSPTASTEWYPSSGRRTQSFEVQATGGGGGGGMHTSWINNPYGPQTRSFDATAPVQHSGNYTDRNTILRKAGSFGGVPAFCRANSGHLDTERTAYYPVANMQTYSSHGSVNHLSPRDTIEEMTDGMEDLQMDPRQRRMPHVQSGNPLQPHQMQRRDVMYAPTMHNQQLYVHSPMVSPIPIYSPRIASHPHVMTTSHAMTPTHSVAAPQPPQMVAVQPMHPQYVQQQQTPVVHHVVSWGSPNTYNYVDASPHAATVPLSYINQPIPITTMHGSMPMQVETHMYHRHVYAAPSTTGYMPQQQATVQQAPPQAFRPGPDHNHPYTGIQTSMDGGYGSMNQESIRDYDVESEIYYDKAPE